MKNFTNNFKQFTSRLSARWLIMALMLLLGTSSAWAANNITIYYVNTNSWEKVNCYAWKYGGSNNGEWPGVSMTKVNNGLYSYILDKDLYNKCIFNYGSSKTDDLTLEDGKYYYAEGEWYSNLEEYYTAKGYVYFNAGDYIYMKNFIPSGWNNTTWIVSNGYAWAHIWGPADDFSSIFEIVSGTHATVGAIYRAEIKTSGWYKNIQFTRTSSNTEPFNGAWNDTETIPLKEGNNCATNWADNGTTAEWEIYTPPANAGFWDLDAWNILYYSGVGFEGWIEGEDNGKVDANATIDLGEMVSQPRLKGFITNVWKNVGTSDVCSVTMTFTDKNGTTQTIASDNQNYEGQFKWRDINDTNGNDQEIECYGLDLLLPCEEGKNSVTFTFTARINNNGTGNCTETTTMTGTIKYEIPKCSVPDGITIKYADGEKFCANSNVTLSPSVEHVDGYTYAWEVSGTGWSINSGSAARECEVKVGTTAGSVKLTVSNATCSKEATNLDITPKASTPIATPTITATKQIICNGNNDSFLSVDGLTSGATYTLVFEGSEQTEPAPIPYTGSESVKFAISKAGSYTVVAKTTDTEACQFTARATDEIDFTSISFSQSEYITTPWVPVSVVVNAPEGTSYEYDDTAITGTTALKDAPIKTVSNNTYTYKLPRPTAWGEGNKTPANADVDFKVSAKITVDTETCNIQSTVKLQDEGNDNCTTTNP